MSNPHDAHVDRPTADRIIQRALQLDAERADSLTEAQIRDIAAELSVSTASVDQALAEQRDLRNNANSPIAISAKPAVRWFTRPSTVFSAIVVATLVAAMFSRVFP